MIYSSLCFAHRPLFLLFPIIITCTYTFTFTSLMYIVHVCMFAKHYMCMLVVNRQTKMGWVETKDMKIRKRTFSKCTWSRNARIKYTEVWHVIYCFAVFPENLYENAGEMVMFVSWNAMRFLLFGNVFINIIHLFFVFVLFVFEFKKRSNIVIFVLIG